MEFYEVEEMPIVSDILTDKFRRFELDLLGVSEVYIPGVGGMKLSWHRIYLLRQEEWGHMDSEYGSWWIRKPAKSLFRAGDVLIIKYLLLILWLRKVQGIELQLVYAPVGQTDGDTSDSDGFYLQLQEQKYRVPVN